MTSQVKTLQSTFSYVKDVDCYVSTDGSAHVLPRKISESYSASSTEVAQPFKIGTLVVNASDGDRMLAHGLHYCKSIDADTSHETVPNSSYHFSEDGALEYLLGVTSTWVKAQRLNTQRN